jgi:hypothetical protein
MVIRFFAVVLVFAGAGCGTQPETQPQALTRRQKDSVIARSSLPGAKAVGKGLEVLSTTEARAAAMDSIR